jgi:hypothetical protein
MSRFAELIRGCQSPTDLYRISIQIETLATPGEVEDLYRQIGTFSESTAAWLKNLRNMMVAEAPALQPFGRRPLGDCVTLYSTRRGADEPRDILIGFCGLADRLQLPVAVICQHLDGSRFDLLLLRDPTKRVFLEGVPGYAPDIEALAARLKADLKFDTYRSVYCLGTSGGGWASLTVGALLGAERALAVSGKVPAPTAKMQHVWKLRGHADRLAETDFDVFERFFAARDNTAPGLLAFFGADNDGDRKDAENFERIAGASAIGFAGVSQHNLMFELLRRRRLATFLTRYLTGDLAAVVPPAGERLLEIEALRPA